VKHGFVFAVKQIRAIARPQAEAQNAETAAEQRRLIAIELHTDRYIPRNGVQAAANVGDGILLHLETPITALQRRNVALQQMVPAGGFFYFARSTVLLRRCSHETFWREKFFVRLVAGRRCVECKAKACKNRDLYM
jgi:hypothetical protein